MHSINISMHIEHNFKFLIDKALWVVVDPWAKQCDEHGNPDEDIEYYKKLDIDLNQHNNIFLDKLKCELIFVPNVVVFQEANVPLNDLFDKSTYPFYKNIKQLSIDAKNYSDIVFCGMHYGLCVHRAVTRLQKKLPDINYYVKRDLCCLMPLHNPHQYDNDLIYHNIQII